MNYVNESGDLILLRYQLSLHYQRQLGRVSLLKKTQRTQNSNAYKPGVYYRKKINTTTTLRDFQLL